jgi:hypothetical protein
MSKTQIVTGGIADDAVSEEHLDATAITGSTELAATPADTDEILISDGGVLKRIDYSHIKTAAGFTKIHSITASDSANVAFDNNYITTSYKTYLIIANGINSVSDAPEFQLHLSTDNGSSFTSGMSRVHLSMEDDDSSINFQHNDEGATLAVIGKSSMGNATGENLSSTITIFGSQDSNSWININAQTVSWGNSMELTWEDSVHGARTTSNLNYIKFQMSSGNIASGIITLYGAN